MTPQRILIVWFRFTLNGAIGRFLNVARVLRERGHQVSFASLTDEVDTDWDDFPGEVLPFARAEEGEYDAVFLPGSGARPKHLNLLKKLRAERFGLRVQFVLNDVSRKNRFLRFNELFRPQLVLFNSHHWQPADFRTFSGRAFCILPGAVQAERFRPHEGDWSARQVWRIGGFSRKNVGPLLDAIERLPEECRLELYGEIPEGVQARIESLEQVGRLTHHGLLFGEELCDFYQMLDLFVITEIRAGWCNPAAEAFASGLPTVVSRAGTIDFAESGENCLVVDPPSGESVAAALTTLMQDGELCRRLSRKARERIEQFSWERYCDQLMEWVEKPPAKAYYQLPEAGLFGKWTPEERMAGLEPILNTCWGATVLDLGCAEGAISFTMGQRGAGVIHAFELEPERAKAAGATLSRLGEETCLARQGDLSDPASFVDEHQEILLEKYDVVLFLGVYHHLPMETRDQALDLALGKADRWFAMRAALDWRATHRVRRKIKRAGFVLVERIPARKETRTGWLAVFERRKR